MFSPEAYLWASSTIASRGFPASLAPRDGRPGAGPPSSAGAGRRVRLEEHNATHGVLVADARNWTDDQAARTRHTGPGHTPSFIKE